MTHDTKNLKRIQISRCFVKNTAVSKCVFGYIQPPPLVRIPTKYIEVTFSENFTAKHFQSLDKKYIHTKQTGN